MELSTSRFSVRSVMEYGISMVRERAALHGIAVTLEVDPAVDGIESDELRIKQVLVNLLSNAVKFTPDGGHVDVVARREGDDLAVTVADDGVGLTGNRRSGLANLRQRAERRGGSLVVDVPPAGTGTRLHWSVPFG